mmetsp:Transcript_18861/g.24643  ORF Transcript_18861/g.24643 Transcript_18861/m.24643 type:complete len:826 (+) Transcript_18861:215-2692(+)
MAETKYPQQASASKNRAGTLDRETCQQTQLPGSSGNSATSSCIGEKRPFIKIASGLCPEEMPRKVARTNEADGSYPRMNSWSHEEEVILIGAVMDRFLTYGSLVTSRRKKKKLGVEKGFIEVDSTKSDSKSKTKDGESSDDLGDKESWASIKEVYDEGLRRILGDKQAYSRSVNALSRHYKVMKTRKNSRFKELFEAWLKTGYASELRNQTFSDDEDEKGNEKEKQRINSWRREEEVMLVGAVVTRFLEYGSLVKKKEICWGRIRETFELAWKNYSVAHNLGITCYRGINALHRHYKVMKARRSNLYPFFNEWENLTRGENSILKPPSMFSTTGVVSLPSVHNQESFRGAASCSDKPNMPQHLAKNRAMLVNATDSLNFQNGTNGYSAQLTAPVQNPKNISGAPVLLYPTLQQMSMYGIMSGLPQRQVPSLGMNAATPMLNSLPWMGNNNQGVFVPNLFNQTRPAAGNAGLLNLSLGLALSRTSGVASMAGTSFPGTTKTGNLASKNIPAATAKPLPSSSPVQSQQEESISSSSREKRFLCKKPSRKSEVEKNTNEESVPGQRPKTLVPEGFRERYNCWSFEEEVILIGIVVERFLSRGSLVTHRRRKGGESADDLECWKSMHEAFEKALAKYCDMSGQPTPYPRTTLAIRRHYKVIKSRKDTSGLHKYFIRWKQLNKGQVLFNDEELRNEDIKNEGNALADQQSARDRWDSWIHLEEVVLIGCVMERFLKYGSLVSVRKKERGSVEVHDSWTDIEKHYSFAWDVLTQQAKKTRPCQRSKNSLSRHYKVMKARRLTCGRLTNELGKFYDEWCDLKQQFPEIFVQS